MRDRCASQVLLISNRTTGLATFSHVPRPSCSPHTPITPHRPGGTPETVPTSPPGGGDPWGVWIDEPRETETELSLRSDGHERGERGKKKIVRLPQRAAILSLTSWAISSAVPGADAGWPSVNASTLPRPRWTATAPRVPWADGRSPPLPAPPLHWRMAAGSGPRQAAVTPPLPPERQPPLHFPGGRRRARASHRQLIPAPRLERPWPRVPRSLLLPLCGGRQQAPAHGERRRLAHHARWQCALPTAAMTLGQPWKVRKLDKAGSSPHVNT